MSYKLDLRGELADTVRTTVREQLEKGAVALTEDAADDPVDAVHSARKHVKKSRALLRLARPALGDKTYRRENRTLRDGARSVAHVRDADVMIETLDALRKRFADELPAKECEQLRADLERDAKRSRAGAGGDLGTELTDALRSVASRVEDWPLEGAGRPVARKGIARAYARGRKAFATADTDPTSENLHELRKRVKDLWYHQRLLRPAWPEVLGAQAEEAHVLSGLLGDDHDLAVLATRLSAEAPTDDTGAVLDVIGQRRAELLARIRALGRRIYAEKPKPFARRLERYLRSAEAAEPVPA